MRTIPDLAICLVTDRRRIAPDARTIQAEVTALDRLLDEAVGAGIDLIQIRERDLDASTLARVSARAVRAAERTSTCVLVNDRADVAIATGADGVHLPSAAFDAARARELRGVRIVGRSLHAGDVSAAAADADYVLFGTIFETRSKPGHAALAGLEGLAAAAQALTVPVLAIGGVTPARVAACVRAGAAGVAAIAPFLPVGREAGALGPAGAVAAFRAALAGIR